MNKMKCIVLIAFGRIESTNLLHCAYGKHKWGRWYEECQSVGKSRRCVFCNTQDKEIRR